MMMPANFSAVSENEMTYVMGGSVADYLCPVMTKKEWSNFSKNMVTLVGNHYVASFLDNTIGAMFSGSWVPGKGMQGFAGQFETIWKNNYTDKVGDNKLKNFGHGVVGVANIGLNIVGNLAAIYNLGFGTAKNVVNDTYGDKTLFTF